MSRLLRPARIAFLLALVVPLAAAPQESAEEYVNRGIAQRERGEFDAAFASFRKAIDLQPDLAAAHFALGEALFLKGQVDDAISSFRKTIELQPNFAPAHFGLGMGLETKGELDEAIVSYREAIEHDPNLALAYVQLGGLLAQKFLDDLGQADEAMASMDEAMASIRKAIELLPDEAVLLKSQLQRATESLARARISGNEAEAIRDFLVVIKAEQNYSRINGGFFDRLDCLGAPSNCIPALPAHAPLLEADIVSLSVKGGYKRTFYLGPPANIEPSKKSSVSPSSISSFAYVAVPVEPGVTGRRGFCGDARGIICYTEDGSIPEAREGVCPPTCINLGAPQDWARVRRAEAVLEKAMLAAAKLPELKRTVEALETELSVVIGRVPAQLDIDGAKAELEQLARRAGLEVVITEVETLDYELYQEAILRFEPVSGHSEAQIADFVASLEEAPRFIRPRQIKGGNQVEMAILASKGTNLKEYDLDFCPTDTPRTSGSPRSGRRETELEMEWEELELLELLCVEMARLGTILAQVNTYRTKVAILEKLKASQ